jgi:hypothetical protein
VLTSSLTAAIGLSAIIMFFALQWPGVSLDWWGNNVAYAGVDGGGWTDDDGNPVSCGLRQIPDGGFPSGF